MRASPAGHDKVSAFLTELTTAVASAVTADAKTNAEIAQSAKLTLNELNGLLAQETLSLPQAMTILSGLTNPSTKPDAAFVAPPYFSVAPAITGTAQDTEELTATSSAIGDATITKTYQWYIADDALGTDEAEIDGETSATYTVVTADVGSVIRVEVTATNSEGAVSAFSPYTAAVIAA